MPELALHFPDFNLSDAFGTTIRDVLHKSKQAEASEEFPPSTPSAHQIERPGVKNGEGERERERRTGGCRNVK